MTDVTTRPFYNSDMVQIPYDGSPVEWRVSAYAIVIQNNSILLCKNKNEKYYDAIGGGIDIGETIQDAVLREGLEEAGAHIKLSTLIEAKQDWFYHKKGVYYQTLLLFYHGTLEGNRIQPSDTQIEWAGFVPLQEVGTKYPVQPILQKIIQMII